MEKSVYSCVCLTTAWDPSSRHHHLAMGPSIAGQSVSLCVCVKGVGRPTKRKHVSSCFQSCLVGLISFFHQGPQAQVITHRYQVQTTFPDTVQIFALINSSHLILTTTLRGRNCHYPILERKLEEGG